MTKQKAIIVSGYFNPLHKGHIESINSAKSLSDALFVIVNNDEQRALKGSKEFQEETERLLIVSNLKRWIMPYSPLIRTARFVLRLPRLPKHTEKPMLWLLPTGVTKTTDRFQKRLFVKNSASL